MDIILGIVVVVCVLGLLAGCCWLAFQVEVERDAKLAAQNSYYVTYERLLGTERDRTLAESQREQWHTNWFELDKKFRGAEAAWTAEQARDEENFQKRVQWYREQLVKWSGQSVDAECSEDELEAAVTARIRELYERADKARLDYDGLMESAMKVSKRHGEEKDGLVKELKAWDFWAIQQYGRRAEGKTAHGQRELLAKDLEGLRKDQARLAEVSKEWNAAQVELDAWAKLAEEVTGGVEYSGHKAARLALAKQLKVEVPQ